MTGQGFPKLVHSLEEYERRTGATLKSGGGDGTFGGMEERVKALETRAERVDGKLDTILRDIGEVKGRLSGIDGKLSSVPTTWTILQINAALLAFAFAIVVGTVSALKAFGII